MMRCVDHVLALLDGKTEMSCSMSVDTIQKPKKSSWPLLNASTQNLLIGLDFEFCFIHVSVSHVQPTLQALWRVPATADESNHTL